MQQPDGNLAVYNLAQHRLQETLSIKGIRFGLPATILCSRQAKSPLLSPFLNRKQQSLRPLMEVIWFGCKKGFIFGLDKLFTVVNRTSIWDDHLRHVMEVGGRMRANEGYVGDINCLCETSHPDYILAGVDNFIVYLLKAGKDQQMAIVAQI